MKQRVARVALGCTCTALALFLALTARFYWEYKTFNLTGYPRQLTVHGRRSDLLYPTSTISYADAVSDDPSRPLQRVDVVRPIPGLRWKEHEVISRFDHGCPTSTYLQVSPDRYLFYSLSGSC